VWTKKRVRKEENPRFRSFNYSLTEKETAEDERARQVKTENDDLLSRVLPSKSHRVQGMKRV
jgi:hypothetical protein